MLRLMRQFRFLFLFLITLLFCLVTAINAELKLSPVTDFIFAILFITSTLVIGEKEEKLLGWIIALGIIQLVQIIMSIWITHAALNFFKAFVALTFFLLLTIATLGLTLKDKTISVTTLFGSLSAYLFIGLTFAYLYLMIYAIYPHSFSGLEPYEEIRGVYYSFITLTTVGYGDVIATSPIMQTLSWIEAFCGQAYMAVFIGLLVGRYVAMDLRSQQ